MILIKNEQVRFTALSPELAHIFKTLSDLNEMRIPNYPIDWTITSINDSKHSPNSKHYQNKAVDIRSKNFGSRLIKIEFKDRLNFALSYKYTVLFEGEGTPNEHFHIQLKKGL
jgi:hypothetical protein